MTETIETLPHDIDTEQALLGAVLANSNVAEHIHASFDARRFYEPLHGRIYAVIMRLIGEGTHISVLTVAPYFRDEPPINDLTVKQYLGRLISASLNEMRSAGELARIVKDYADRREMISAYQDGIELAKNFEVSVAQSAAEGVKILDGIICSSRAVQPWVTVEQSSQAYIDELDKPKRNNTIPTGFNHYDRMTGGFKRGRYDLLAGRTGMGKSAMAVKLAINPAKRGFGVLMFSMEMDPEELTGRMLSSIAWEDGGCVEYSEAEKGRLTREQKDRLRKADERLKRLPIILDTDSALTMAAISARGRRHQARLAGQGITLGVIIVDHIGLVKPSNRYKGNMTAELGEVSQGLRALAKDLNVAVLGLAQLNREVENRDYKRPLLSDLRWSGDLEQDAYVVGLLYRPAYYLKDKHKDGSDEEIERLKLLSECQHDLELSIAKNRGGPTGTVNLWAHMGANHIEDADSEQVRNAA
jgi:replicative DNA helicase